MGATESTLATSTEPERDNGATEIDHAQAYVLMVAEANCTGAHLDRIAGEFFGDGPRTVIYETDWPAIQQTVMPAYRAWGEALQRLQVAVRSHPWPADLRAVAAAQADSYDTAITWALAYANAPTIDAFVTQGYVLPPGNSGAGIREALGLPVGPADTTDYCYLAGLPSP